MRRGRRWWAIGCVVGGVLLLGAPVDAAQLPPLDGAPLCGTERGAGGAAGRTEDGTLRVATYNILHTLEDDANATIDTRIELVADALAGSRVDAAGLQEVVASANHGLVVARVATAMAQRTGDDWHWCFFRSNPHIPGEPDLGPGGVGGPLADVAARSARPGDAPWSEGVAIVARYPIAATAAHRLVARMAEVPFCILEHPDDPLAGPTCALDTRQVLWARVAAPCGDLDLFSTHLAHTLSSQSGTIRLLQVDDALATIDRLAEPGPLPDVYVGDFNSVEGSPVHAAVLDAGFVDTYRFVEPDDAGHTGGQDITAPSATVDGRIDYVFARAGSEPLTVAEAEVIGDAPSPLAGGDAGAVVWPSDHYGVAVSVAPCGTAGVPTTADARGGPAAPADALAVTGDAHAAAAVGVLVLAVALLARAILAPWERSSSDPSAPVGRPRSQTGPGS